MPTLRTLTCLTTALALSALVTAGCKKSEDAPAPGASASAAAAAAPAAVAKIKSSALEHLPASCDVALSIDVAKLLALPAAKTHLAPAIEEAKKAKPGDADDQKLLELLSASDLDPTKDVHTAAACVINPQAETSPTVLLVLGGEFKPDSIAEVLAKGSKDAKLSELDGRKLASDVSKKGVTTLITQAADGAILISTDQALLESALKPSAAHKDSYGLTADGELGFALAQKVMGTVAADRNNPFGKALKDVTRINGLLRLAGTPGGEIRLATGSAAAATEASTTVTAMLTLFKSMSKNEKSQAGELEALNSAKTRVDGNDVVIEAAWTAEGLEKAAAELAKALREATGATKEAIAK